MQPRIQLDKRVIQKFGLSQTDLVVLTKNHFPAAQADTIVIALAMCAMCDIDWRVRPLEIMTFAGVDKIIAGQTWWRTIAHKSGNYVGALATEFGDKIQRNYKWTDSSNQPQSVDVVVAEWAQVTIQKKVGGQVCNFAGPRTYWDEGSTIYKSGQVAPMHAAKPNFILEKQAEVAALRKAFAIDANSDDSAAIEAAAIESSELLINPGASLEGAVDGVASAVGFEGSIATPPPAPKPAQMAPRAPAPPKKVSKAETIVDTSQPADDAIPGWLT